MGEASISRSAFIARALKATGAAAVLPGVLIRTGLAGAAATGGGLVVETLNGLAAFVVPGPDEYSTTQGESTSEPGGVAAHAGEALAGGLELVQPGLSAQVATLLNGLTVAVYQGAGTGAFSAPFANAPFAVKGKVFEILEGAPQFEQLRSLAGVLPGLVAFLAYSEVGVFDPSSRTLVGTPVGWTISSYGGVADGHAELIGYFENRRRVDA
jgi:hypothetical protein